MPSFNIIALFSASALLQVLGMSVLPLTQGFTRVGSTLVVLICYAAALTMMAKIIHQGVNLSILMPFLVATIPILTIFVGIVYYGEPASYMRVALLLAATGLITVASML